MDSDDEIHCLWKDCERTFFDAEILYSHLTNDHVGRKSTGNLCLTCHWDDCEVTVIKRDHITSHLRVHVPLKPHRCSYCKKAFKRPQDLKKHEKIHTEEHIATLRSHTRYHHHHQQHQQQQQQAQFISQQPMHHHPLTPPRIVDGYLSPMSKGSPRHPVSPPHSTYSEDISSGSDQSNWMHSQQYKTSISPSTDLSDQFPMEVMQQYASVPMDKAYVASMPVGPFSSPEDALHGLFANDNKMLPQYDDDAMQRLDYLQQMMAAGAFVPSQLNLQISSEQQLADMNQWLAQLGASMDGGGAPLAGAGAGAGAGADDMMMSTDPMLTQGFHPAQYDQYVRSAPIDAYYQAPTVPSQQLDPQQPPQPQQHAWNGAYVPSQDVALGTIVGQRTHVPPQADILQDFNDNKIIHTQYVTSGDGMAYDNPNTRVDKKNVDPVPRPKVDAAAPTVNDKENITHVVNVFAAIPLQGETASIPDEKTKNAKPAQKDADVPKPKPTGDTIQDLLVNFNDMHLESKPPTTKPAPIARQQAQQRHRQLLRDISTWIQQAYDNQSPASKSSNPSNSPLRVK
ncbi:hypothetical protein BC940DRAFT_251426 [Gongronella butleri]|nr:hypothetical protein BC940DRAFT_251426 [Gongronella butleri]